jgi:hypothetical protein
MKNILYLTVLGIVTIFGLGSCKKYLDVNSNPNSATTSTPELILPQALTSTANVVNSYNTMGAELGGYMANAGGYGGFGSSVTYSFGTGDYQGLWTSTYDNLTDYQWIITHTEGDLNYGFYNAAAKIMKAFDFQLLVDTYNDVPYSDAFQEKKNLTPKYDDAKAIYDSLYALLDNAIKTINDAQADLDNNASSSVKQFSNNDVMFGGNMDNWKKFANTVKLRLAVRARGILTFNNQYDPVGFLTQDAEVNPGYQVASGKQNPEYNTWGYTYTGATGNRAWIPTKWIASFYNGSKLDDYRGYAILNGFATPSTFPVNQLGYESNSVLSAPSAGGWITPYEDKSNNIGVLKGPSAPMQIITAAESDFLQAEAALEGGLGVDGDPQTLFYQGILDSYKYVYRLADGSYDLTNWDPQADYQAYLDLNPDNYLVHYELAANDAQRLEAIITQKYIAMNMVNSDQGWNDFRRTGYPKIVNGSTSGTATFASLQSVSTRADKLPARILYPTSESSYNNENVPKDVNQFTSRIFWDPE